MSQTMAGPGIDISFDLLGDLSNWFNFEVSSLVTYQIEASA